MNEGIGTSMGDSSSASNDGILLNMDENTDWVTGFVAPGSDVGVIGIVSPAIIGPVFNDHESVTIEIKNYSTETVSNFDVSYQIDGGTVITETISETLLAFETTTYTFSSTVDLLGTASIDIVSYTGLSSDTNTDNDSISINILPTELFTLFDGVQHNYGSAGQTNTTTGYITQYQNLLGIMVITTNI
jgi:hypothetical protein